MNGGRTPSPGRSASGDGVRVTMRQRSIYVTIDLEGVTGVTALDQVRHGSPEFHDTRLRLTDEVNAAIAGAREAGLASVLVNEGHGQHRNIVPERLDQEARLLTGRNKLLHYMHGIDGGFDGAFFIGYHAGAGERDGVLGHTFHAARCLINDRPFTEVSLGMALAGHHGVPTLLVTGDEATCRHARACVAGIETVAVKEAISANAAVHMHPDAAQRAIREAAQRALARADDIQPFIVPSPHVLDLHLYSPLMADLHEYVPTCQRMGDLHVRYTASDMADAFRFFLLSSTLSMTASGLGVMH